MGTLPHGGALCSHRAGRSAGILPLHESADNMRLDKLGFTASQNNMYTRVMGVEELHGELEHIQ